jgi:bifunctional UDP-N-acetylglucosamine pyrophosphorylase/glucosamine-1-phosphate N-acetyltransferase
LSVIILAAGEGKRMKSALPKVLLPLAGRPLLAHVIDTARALAPAAIHVVYGHGGERVREAMSGQLAGEPVQWALQAQQLGTGHAVLQAIPGVPDDHLALVLYGDVPLLSRQTLAQLVALAGPRQVALLTMTVDDPTGYGRIVRDGQGRVLRIAEQKDASAEERAIRECNTGVLAAPAKLLKGWLEGLKAENSQREYYLTDIIAMAVRDKVAVNPLGCADAIEALGVNDKVQLAFLESVCRQRAARELMLAGVTVADPDRIDVRGRVTHGKDVFIDVNVVFEGQVKLGDRVRIGPNCNIGPFARFRPTSRLSAGVHVGNFVEVKNSTMADDSKANHLSYVGDAQVGARVNIGAGTIIANYDGANKHRTIIEDDVHTGSNSVLVAPITIGAGATVAAGSTVANQVPAGKLTIARARQTTIEGWNRPTKEKK